MSERAYWRTVAFGTASALGLAACATPADNTNETVAAALKPRHATIEVYCPEDTERLNIYIAEIEHTVGRASERADEDSPPVFSYSDALAIVGCMKADGSLRAPISTKVTDGNPEGIELLPPNEYSDSADVRLHNGMSPEDLIFERV